MGNKQMIRNQLTQRLALFSSLKSEPRPVSGWLRAIRSALNMSTPQLAKRLGVSKQRISALEKAEVDGSATINSLRKAAEALDCTLVYAILPRDSLDATIEKQARKVAARQQAYATHTMSMEDQSPSEREQKEALDAAVAELVRTSPKELWDEVG